MKFIIALIAAVTLMILGGWISYSASDHSFSATFNTDEARRDTEAAADEVRRFGSRVAQEANELKEELAEEARGTTDSESEGQREDVEDTRSDAP